MISNKTRVWNDKLKVIMYSGFSINPNGDVYNIRNEKTDWEIMHSTGTFDKSGVEIYEGDILKGGIYLEYEVEWSDENNGFNISSQHIIKNFEIIGNKYEGTQL